MKPLYIGSVMERSGKSAIALGLAKSLGDVGYFKPFKESSVEVDGKMVDRDALLMASALGLDHSPEEISPFIYDIFAPPSFDEILHAYEQVKKDKMIIEGTRDVITGWTGNLSGMAIARDLRAEVILVSPAVAPAIDKICMLNSFMKQTPGLFKGVILNQIEDKRCIDLLEKRGIQVLGAVPVMEELKRFRVSEVASILAAEVLVQGKDCEIENVVIGAMNSESAIAQMRRVPAKALITGGDRADIQNIALSTDLACLVLTGGFHPSNAVLSLAYELGVTVLLTHLDTMDAVETVNRHLAYISPQDEGKIRQLTEAVRENVDLQRIME
ncbi:DRTGG domain-containing protein [Candidatus Methanomassiliicoccus intestinalis]|uniref:DRTGG domain-containing protein n=1 Tax=Candidatus Methanomassiliicoccus intestinalis TaxID=1406512 RepID=UPI0037DD80A3